MPTFPTIEDQLAEALAAVRRARHKPGCQCWVGHLDRPPYCSTQESSWGEIVSKLLNRARERSTANTPPTPRPAEITQDSRGR